MSLQGKNAIITGASRGIGLAIAERFAEEGCSLVICSTKKEKSDEVAEHLSGKYGVDAIGCSVDISSSESCKSCIQTALDAFSSIDILVNNAGITKDNLLLRMNDDEWTSVINTNLNSAFYMSKPLLRSMMKNKKGTVINISSVVGLMGNQGQANYAASKAGMIGFTQSLAKELGSRNIRANVIAPGFIDTDMMESLPGEYIDNIIKSIPLGRLGEAEDVANLAVFLASDQSLYITGQVFSVDGGIYM